MSQMPRSGGRSLPCWSSSSIPVQRVWCVRDPNTTLFPSLVHLLLLLTSFSPPHSNSLLAPTAIPQHHHLHRIQELGYHHDRTSVPTTLRQLDRPDDSSRARLHPGLWRGHLVRRPRPADDTRVLLPHGQCALDLGCRSQAESVPSAGRAPFKRSSRPLYQAGQTSHRRSRERESSLWNGSPPHSLSRSPRRELLNSTLR